MSDKFSLSFAHSRSTIEARVGLRVYGREGWLDPAQDGLAFNARRKTTLPTKSKDRLCGGEIRC
jgi:hypothetical protein